MSLSEKESSKKRIGVPKLRPLLHPDPHSGSAVFFRKKDSSRIGGAYAPTREPRFNYSTLGVEYEPIAFELDNDAVDNNTDITMERTAAGFVGSTTVCFTSYFGAMCSVSLTGGASILARFLPAESAPLSGDSRRALTVDYHLTDAMRLRIF